MTQFQKGKKTDAEKVVFKENSGIGYSFEVDMNAFMKQSRPFPFRVMYFKRGAKNCRQ